MSRTSNVKPRQWKWCLYAIFACVLMPMTNGCFGGPGRLKVPKVDAEAAGSKAMAKYDTNGDGGVGGDELQKAPSLLAARVNLDTDSNGQISAEEVASLVRGWAEGKIGRMPALCSVTRNGEPLVGATVTYEPEDFLGGSLSTASGVTNQQGVAMVRIPDVNPPGAQCGLYLIKVTKLGGGKETIPAKYNSETIYGVEVGPRAGQASIDLKY